MTYDGRTSSGGILGGRLGAQGRWRLALGLLLLGGVLGIVALFSPWATGLIYPPQTFNQGHITIRMYDPFLSSIGWMIHADIRHARLLRALLPPLYYLYVALGTLLALALFVWRGPRVRRALLIAEALWLAALLLNLMVYSAQLITGHAADPLLQDAQHLHATVAVVPASGLWLGWLAAALGGVGLALAYQSFAGALAAGTAMRAIQQPRERLELGGAALATVGLVLWAVGYYTLPWLTQGCSGLHFSLNHFVSGSCSGLDAADVFANSSLTGLSGRLISGPSDPLAFAVYPLTDAAFHYVFLGLLSLVATARLWWGAVGARRYGWTLAWLLCAGFVAGYTAQGAARSLTLSPAFTFGSLTQEAWSYGPGLGATLVGLALAALGLAGLFVARWVSRRVAEPAVLVEV